MKSHVRSAVRMQRQRRTVSAGILRNVLERRFVKFGLLTSGEHGQVKRASTRSPTKQEEAHALDFAAKMEASSSESSGMYASYSMGASAIKSRAAALGAALPTHGKAA